MKDDPLLALIAVFVPFSLISIGGGPSIFAGIQHQSVEVQQWMTAREFINFFAISRAAPGPGSMLATLVGWHLDGWIGALVATLALFVPSSILFYVVAMQWRKHRGKRWHTALEQGLAPVGVGLVLAGAVSILSIGSGGVLAWIVAGGAAVLLAWRPKFHPLYLFVIGGAIFVTARMVFQVS